jgi:hypothetical protein
MNTQYARVALLIGVLLVPFSAAQADHEIWHSPLTASTANPDLTIQPHMPSVSIRVTTANPGDLQWVDIPLVLPSDVVIDYVTVCYELASSESFISQVRLTWMTLPDAAYVIHDDPTDLTDPGPDCYVSVTDGDPVVGTITLALRLNFASVDDWIDIGGIAIGVHPVGSAVPGDEDAIGPHGLMLKQNQPNPFGLWTVIEYELQQAAAVELEIFDATGRVVKMLSHQDESPGNHQFVWDGRDAQGREVPSGKYYYQIRVGDEVGSRGMVLLR